jgi:hypothetical protein
VRNSLILIIKAYLGSNNFISPGELCWAIHLDEIEQKGQLF